MPQPTKVPRAAATAAGAKQDPESDKSSWLGGAVRALFTREVRERRVDGKLAVGPDQREQPAATGAEPMRTELKALFDAAPQNRLLLRVLGAVEHGLKHKDPTGLFLFEVEPERLRVILRQFDGLAPATLTPGLAALRARIVDALTSRERKQKRTEMIAPRSDLMRNNRVAVAEVAEGGATDFDRLHAQWKGGPKAD
jgi:hypothetical protein